MMYYYDRFTVEGAHTQSRMIDPVYDICMAVVLYDVLLR